MLHTLAILVTEAVIDKTGQKHFSSAVYIPKCSIRVEGAVLQAIQVWKPYKCDKHLTLFYVIGGFGNE